MEWEIAGCYGWVWCYVMGVRLGVMDVVAGINGDLGDQNRVGVGA